ncbi:hypothetical protein [Sphingomonas psychrotolerans]|uniref:hypothetical protein n=1 Tax=Sphingomonas psychrotolerans TaxID=1327635 RepID=UPI00130542FE|nr:hypothetical protein [Sphingomonas psychrotolerans]
MKMLLSLLAAGSLGASGTVAKLDAYVGKYPHEKVGPTTFLTNPAVRAAIVKAVPDADIRNFIADRDMTTAPIRKIDDRLLASGWDHRSGGDVNWAVLMSRDGSRTAVCYSTGVEPNVRGADWYVDGAKVFTLYARCPSEAEDLKALGTFPIGAIPG